MTMQQPAAGRRRFIAGLLFGVAMAPFSVTRSSARSTQANGLLPPIKYDQGMGATDELGLVKSFPLREFGAMQIFVDPQRSKPHYNGLSPFAGFALNGRGTNRQNGATGPGLADDRFGPVGSFAQAIDRLIPASNGRPGEGWQVFLAEGQTFPIDATRNQWSYLRGHSTAFPFCLQSYDPRDPLNLLKHGRAGMAGQLARPELVLGTSNFWPFVGRGDPFAYDNWVFRGLKLVNRTDRGQALGYAYCVNNLLIENCILDGVQLTFQNSNPHPGLGQSKNVIVRRVASFGQYDVGGAHSCGIYSANTDLTVEDCVFYHCGWKIGVSRNTPVNAGGPDPFKHCLYLAAGSGTTVTVRRVVMVDSSAAGLSLRGNHLCHHNVMIDCPTSEFKGAGSVSDSENPDGVLQQSYCQFFLGGGNINDSLPRGQGFSSSAGKPGSFFAYSLFANNPHYGEVNNNCMQILGNIARQRSFIQLYGNRAYAFAPPARAILTGGRFPATVSITAFDNVASPSSPAKTADIYRAVGAQDKRALVAAMIANPMANWAYLILNAAGRAFNFNFNPTLPLR